MNTTSVLPLFIPLLVVPCSVVNRGVFDPVPFLSLVVHSSHVLVAPSFEHSAFRFTSGLRRTSSSSSLFDALPPLPFLSFCFPACTTCFFARTPHHMLGAYVRETSIGHFPVPSIVFFSPVPARAPLLTAPSLPLCCLW